MHNMRIITQEYSDLFKIFTLPQNPPTKKLSVASPSSGGQH